MLVDFADHVEARRSCDDSASLTGVKGQIFKLQKGARVAVVNVHGCALTAVGFSVLICEGEICPKRYAAAAAALPALTSAGCDGNRSLYG